MTPSLLMHCLDSFDLTIHFHFLVVQQTFGMERCLWKKTICWWNPKNTTKCCCYTQKCHIPSISAWLPYVISRECCADSRHLNIEEEKGGYDQTRYNSSKYPARRQSPEFDNEMSPIGGSRTERCCTFLVSIVRVIICEEFGAPLTGHRQPLLI